MILFPTLLSRMISMTVSMSFWLSLSITIGTSGTVTTYAKFKLASSPSSSKSQSNQKKYISLSPEPSDSEIIYEGDSTVWPNEIADTISESYANSSNVNSPTTQYQLSKTQNNGTLSNSMSLSQLSRTIIDKVDYVDRTLDEKFNRGYDSLTKSANHAASQANMVVNQAAKELSNQAQLISSVTNHIGANIRSKSNNISKGLNKVQRSFISAIDDISNSVSDMKIDNSIMAPPQSPTNDLSNAESNSNTEVPDLNIRPTTPSSYLSTSNFKSPMFSNLVNKVLTPRGSVDITKSISSLMPRAEKSDKSSEAKKDKSKKEKKEKKSKKSKKKDQEAQDDDTVLIVTQQEPKEDSHSRQAQLRKSFESRLPVTETQNTENQDDDNDSPVLTELENVSTLSRKFAEGRIKDKNLPNLSIPNWELVREQYRVDPELQVSKNYNDIDVDDNGGLSDSDRSCATCISQFEDEDELNQKDKSNDSINFHSPRTGSSSDLLKKTNEKIEDSASTHVSDSNSNSVNNSPQSQLSNDPDVKLPSFNISSTTSQIQNYQNQGLLDPETQSAVLQIDPFTKVTAQVTGAWYGRTDLELVLMQPSDSDAQSPTTATSELQWWGVRIRDPPLFRYIEYLRSMSPQLSEKYQSFFQTIGSGSQGSFKFTVDLFDVSFNNKDGRAQDRGLMSCTVEVKNPNYKAPISSSSRLVSSFLTPRSSITPRSSRQNKTDEATQDTGSCSGRGFLGKALLTAIRAMGKSVDFHVDLLNGELQLRLHPAPTLADINYMKELGKKWGLVPQPTVATPRKDESSSLNLDSGNPVHTKSDSNTPSDSTTMSSSNSITEQWFKLVYSYPTDGLVIKDKESVPPGVMVDKPNKKIIDAVVEMIM